MFFLGYIHARQKCCALPALENLQHFCSWILSIKSAPNYVNFGANLLWIFCCKCLVQNMSIKKNVFIIRRSTAKFATIQFHSRFVVAPDFPFEVNGKNLQNICKFFSSSWWWEFFKSHLLCSHSKCCRFSPRKFCAENPQHICHV